MKLEKTQMMDAGREVLELMFAELSIRHKQFEGVIGLVRRDGVEWSPVVLGTMSSCR